MGVKDFVKQWANVVGKERANYQKFWLTLIRDVLGVDKPENFIQFEVPVQLAHKSFIDGYFPDTKVIVEQKSYGVDLEQRNHSIRRIEAHALRTGAPLHHGLAAEYAPDQNRHLQLPRIPDL